MTYMSFVSKESNSIVFSFSASRLRRVQSLMDGGSSGKKSEQIDAILCIAGIQKTILHFIGMRKVSLSQFIDSETCKMYTKCKIAVTLVFISMHIQVHVLTLHKISMYGLMQMPATSPYQFLTFFSWICSWIISYKWESYWLLQFFPLNTFFQALIAGIMRVVMSLSTISFLDFLMSGEQSLKSESLVIIIHYIVTLLNYKKAICHHRIHCNLLSGRQSNK